MALPVSFSNLPGPGPPLHWGYNIVKAHEVICQHYTQALHVLFQEDEDPLHLHYHIQHLKGCVVPLLQSMENTQLPGAWISNSAHCIGQLLHELEEAARNADTQCVLYIDFIMILIIIQRVCFDI